VSAPAGRGAAPTGGRLDRAAAAAAAATGSYPRAGAVVAVSSGSSSEERGEVVILDPGNAEATPRHRGVRPPATRWREAAAKLGGTGRAKPGTDPHSWQRGTPGVPIRIPSAQPAPSWRLRRECGRPTVPARAHTRQPVPRVRSAMAAAQS